MILRGILLRLMNLLLLCFLTMSVNGFGEVGNHSEGSGFMTQALKYGLGPISKLVPPASKKKPSTHQLKELPYNSAKREGACTGFYLRLKSISKESLGASIVAANNRKARYHKLIQQRLEAKAVDSLLAMRSIVQ